MEIDLRSIMALATAVILFAKMGVDMAKKMGLTDTRWYPPLALVIATGMALALVYQQTGSIGVSQAITAVAAGFVAAAGAVGVTELQRTGDAAKDARKQP
jgi:nitrate/nitrite transporter NarK